MAKQQLVKIPISSKYTERERQAIAEEIIDFIVDRTQSKSLDKDNKKFPGYSKSYKESLDFKVAGKSSKVDLTLSGEMLGELKYLKNKSGSKSLAIGFPEDPELNGKVEGNRLGTYGKKSPMPGKSRDFLGIHPSDLQKILEKYPLNDKKERSLALRIAERLREEAESIEERIELRDELE